MSFYFPKPLVCIKSSLYRDTLNAKDIWIVESVSIPENKENFSPALLNCTNLLSGEKIELANNVIEEVLPGLAKCLLEEEFAKIRTAMIIVGKNISLFTEVKG